MRYYSNWLEFKNDEMVVHNYSSCNDSYNLKHALKKQAQSIYEKYKNLNLLLSGGIDSHMMACGFIESKIPCKFTHFNIKYQGKENEAELFFVKEFMNEYNIDINIVDYDFNHEDVVLFAKEKDWVNTGCGVGHLLQLLAYEDYKNKCQEYFVSGVGGLVFCEGEGRLTNFAKFASSGFDFESNIPFIYYAPFLIQYYEKVHKTSKLYQWYNRFEPKHLAFTELGLFLRPKLNTSECLHDKDYRDYTRLDFGKHLSVSYFDEGNLKYFKEKFNLHDKKNLEVFYSVLYSLNEDNYSEILK